MASALDSTRSATGHAAGARLKRLGARADSVAGSMLGWLFSAFVATAHLQSSDPAWKGSTALVHTASVAAHLLGCGALVTVLVWLYRRLGWRSPWAWRISIVLAATPPLYFLLGDDMGGVARRLGSVVPREVTVAGAAMLCAFLLALAVELGRRLRRARWLALGPAAIALWLEPGVLRGLYPGLHALTVLAVACFVGSALRGVGLPRVLGRNPGRWLGLVGLLGCAASAVPVSPRVHFRVVRDGDVVAQIAGDILPRREVVIAPVPADAFAGDTWLRPRDELPDVAPTAGSRFASDPVVVLLTVDCLRYDLVGGQRPRARLPSLARLRSEGLLFTDAHTPGSSTVYTLTSLFSGKYYSQLEWSGPRGDVWPRRDRTARFPELLSPDVWTVHATSFNWLDDAHGVTRGFEVEDYDAESGPRWKTAETLGADIVARLGEVGERSAFLYAHFNDAHMPYDRAGRRGSPFERYVGELRLVDTQIGRILDAVEELGLASRALVIRHGGPRRGVRRSRPDRARGHALSGAHARSALDVGRAHPPGIGREHAGHADAISAPRSSTSSGSPRRLISWVRRSIRRCSDGALRRHARSSRKRGICARW